MIIKDIKQPAYTGKVELVDQDAYKTKLSKAKAVKECPWATKIVKVIGGYLCFELVTDHYLWENWQTKF